MENKNKSVHITFLLFPDLLIPIILPGKLWRYFMILFIRAIHLTCCAPIKAHYGLGGLQVISVRIPADRLEVSPASSGFFIEFPIPRPSSSPQTNSQGAALTEE